MSVPTMARHPLSKSWRPLRGPFQRWPRISDAVLAFYAFSVSLFTWMPISAVQPSGQPGWPWVATFLLMLIGNGALYWRRRQPVLVHLLIVMASALVLLIGESSNGVFGMVFSLYSLGRYAADERASIVGLTLSLILVAVDQFVVEAPSLGGIFAAMFVVGLWYLGKRLRFRGEYLRLLEERAAHFERERAADAAQAVAAERTRIARELHDVVAHQVSLMTVQAGAAKTIAREQPDAAITAMGAVETAGRRALDELRHVLGVLRPIPPNQEPDPQFDPQPGSSELPELIQGLKNAGLDVSLTTKGLKANLPARVDLAIYRIVQESLTNVLKHAGERTATRVSVVVNDRGVLIEVVDDGVATPTKSGSGRGISGMRERAQILGGSLDAGPLPEGGFKVRAYLPLERSA